MRMIDANKFRRFAHEQLENDKLYSADDILEMIDEQPTAFDVEAVVDCLLGLKMRYFLTLANTGDSTNDFAYKNVGNAIDKAIEIVKGGVK